jgi:hypothetical protein
MTRQLANLSPQFGSAYEILGLAAHFGLALANLAVAKKTDPDEARPDERGQKLTIRPTAP